MLRNYLKLMTIDDYRELDVPIPNGVPAPGRCPYPEQMVLRMLVRPKYGRTFLIPDSLEWLANSINLLSREDLRISGTENSWCYVTVRYGNPKHSNVEDWHFDGFSLRTEVIPDRNFIITDHTPTEYKSGELKIPPDFDPMIHNLYSFAAESFERDAVQKCESGIWYFLSPFCLHRQPPTVRTDESRMFIRVTFLDVEIRDIHNTPNPLLPTDAYGRDPVHSFRNNLKRY